MKAMALRLTESQLVDITHEIQPQNIQEGAFILYVTAHIFPPGTVHVAVVDPGVGTARRGLLITTRTQIFIGPDNGLLIPAARSIGNMHVYKLTNEKYMCVPQSKTFAGRDIFTPIAAHVINGVSFEEFGTRIDDWTNLDFGDVNRRESSLTGKILYIDRFGNIITNIVKKDLIHPPLQDGTVRITMGKTTRDIPFVPAYGFVKSKQVLVTVGSSNYVEIAMNQGNAAQKLKAAPDMPVTITFD
jgi:S-adenosylmethionine hydrolase